MLAEQFLSRMMRFGVSVQIRHVVCLVVTIGTRLHDRNVLPCMLLQLRNNSACKVTIVFRAWKLYSAVHFTLMIKQNVFVLEDLFTVLAEVDNFVVLLQQVALQWLSLSAFVFTLMTLEPVCKNSWFLAWHRWQRHATCIPQFRRSTYPGSHDRLDDWKVEHLSSEANGGLVVVFCFHLHTMNDQTMIMRAAKNQLLK